MYINLFLLCAGFIYVQALPARFTIGDAKIFDQFDIYMNATCPAFRDNVLVNRTTKYLLTCKDVELQNPPEAPALINCMAIIASNVQLCKAIGNRQYNVPPKTVADLYKLIVELKTYNPEEICKQFTQIDLFNESANITYIDHWTKELLHIFKSKKCVFACSEMADDNTNPECSLLFFINSMVRNVTQQSLIANESLNTQKIGTENVSIDTATTIKVVESVVKATTNIAKSDKVQNTTILNVKTVESNSLPHATSVAPSLEKKQPPLKVISSPKLDNKPSLSSNAQSEGDTHIAADNNVNGNSANIIPKPETTIPEEPTTHPTIAAVVPVKLKPAAEKPPIVSHVDVSQPAQNDIDIELTTDPSSVAEIRDNQEEDYTNEDGEEEVAPNENNKPAQVISSLNGNDIYGAEQKISTGGDHFVEVEDSNFFSYFMFISVMFIVGYVVYHNKQKIMALLLEGRRDRNSRRRPNTSSYRKLNSNLEEAVTSKCSGTAAHVIY